MFLFILENEKKDLIGIPAEGIDEALKKAMNYMFDYGPWEVVESIVIRKKGGRYVMESTD